MPAHGDRGRPEIAARETVCEQCDGAGVTITERDGTRYVQDCACREAMRAVRLLARVGIPDRYRAATLDSYQPTNASQQAALLKARGYVRRWPEDRSAGLIFQGTVGTGKTHLAAAILRELVVAKGARCAFAGMRQLLSDLRESFGEGGRKEHDILRPLLESEVVVLDELGATMHTDWTFNTVAHVIGSRYDAGLATIVTTNYPVAQAKSGPRPAGSYGQAADAIRAETLGDRIGAPMLSRVLEMCQSVEVSGADYRAR